MPDIHIHRQHSLGLTKARKVAWDWAELAEQKFDMTCTVTEGSTSDTVAFARSGVKGGLVVAADHFVLQAKLGFLLGAFSKTIEAEIEKNLDTLLGAANSANSAGAAGAANSTGAAAAARAAKPAKAPAKPAAAKKKAAQKS